MAANALLATFLLGEHYWRPLPTTIVCHQGGRKRLRLISFVGRWCRSHRILYGLFMFNLVGFFTRCLNLRRGGWNIQWQEFRNKLALHIRAQISEKRVGEAYWSYVTNDSDIMPAIRSALNCVPKRGKLFS